MYSRIMWIVIKECMKVRNGSGIVEKKMSKKKLVHFQYSK